LEPEECLRVDVAGAGIEVLTWGERGKPGLLLAHGSRAHARWWGAVAPLLGRQFRVASLSWSGMGGSDWRDAYSIDQQVEELFCAGAAAGLFAGARAPIAIGHSFGARAVVWAAAIRGEALAGAVLVDSAVMPNRWPTAGAGNHDPCYETLEAALARFNLRPPQPCANLFLLDAIARASLERKSKGWGWRFDPGYYDKHVYADVWPALARPRCPLALVYGAHSRALGAEQLDALRRQAPAGSPFIPIADAGHHIMVDQPIALAAVLGALAQTWHQGAAAAQGGET
jgi:pimeloyl-ACP methyl ester carboxylesterase